MKDLNNIIGAGAIDDEWQNLFSNVDETAEREKAYQEVVAAYPLDPKMDCLTLQAKMKDLDLQIAIVTEQRAAGATDRVGLRYILGYQRRKADFAAVYNQKQCETQIETAKSEVFLEQQYTQLEKVQNLAKETGSAATYVIWGMIGLVVLVSGIFIVKKLRK